MKRFDKKFLGIAFAIALFASLSSCAYADKIAVWSDSATMTAAVGTSTEAQISVFAINVDTLNDTLQSRQQHTVHVSLTGSSEFQLMSDSVLTFLDNGTITVQYSPTSLTIPEAVLTIVGDSNTLQVTLVGRPLSHIAPTIRVGEYYPVHVNHEDCQAFGVTNTNSDSIWLTQVILTDDSVPGMQWSLDSVLPLPVGIAGHASITMGQICAYVTTAAWDTTSQDTALTANLKIIYRYVTGTDSTSTGVNAIVAPPQTECVSASSGGFGTMAAGESVTTTITLTNTTDTSVYLDSEQIVGTDHGLFTLNSPSFPLVVPVDSSVKLSITFQAPATSAERNYYATLVASVHGISTDDVPCNSLSIPLGATVAIPIVDSVTLDVPPGSNTLSIVARTTQSRHAIFIKNMESSSILIQGLTIDDTSTGAYFGTPGNKTDHTDDSMSIAAGEIEGPILLTLDEQDTGTYNIDLTLNYVIQQAHQKGAVPTSNSLTYTVVAHRLPPIAESVSEPNAPPTTDFALMPNPARDAVTIVLRDGAPSTVQVYDVLGNLILSRVAQGEFVWNGESNTGSLANGTYIVRVSQGDHTSSKRLVIVR